MTASATSVTDVASRPRARVSVPAATLVFVVYCIIFIGLLKQSGIPYTELVTTADNTLQGPVRSLIGGTIWLVVFLLWARWDHVFTDWRRLRMGFWLWLPAGLMIVAFGMQFAGVEWGKFTGAHLMWIVVAGVLVGFAEETLFRGIILRALREGGRQEGFVVLVSACGSGSSTSPTWSSAHPCPQSFSSRLRLDGRHRPVPVATGHRHARGRHGDPRPLGRVRLPACRTHGRRLPVAPARLGRGHVVYLTAVIALIIIWRRRDVAAVDHAG